MEEALRAAGPAPDLARDRRGAVPRLGPEVARERRRQRRAAGDHRLRQRLPASSSTEVYKTFQPFDLDEGTGVVVAPARGGPAPARSQFTIKNPPELGKVWAAQERLWIQRTLLEVIAEVNKDAKDWDTAIIKQINLLEVGNALAQDQNSIAKGETLDEAPAIANPADPAPPPPADPAAGGEAAAGMGGDATAPRRNADTVYYIKTDSTQFKILPFRSRPDRAGPDPGLPRRPRELADGDPGHRLRDGQAEHPRHQAREGGRT